MCAADLSCLLSLAISALCPDVVHLGSYGADAFSSVDFYWTNRFWQGVTPDLPSIAKADCSNWWSSCSAFCVIGLQIHTPRPGCSFIPLRSLHSCHFRRVCTDCIPANVVRVAHTLLTPCTPSAAFACVVMGVLSVWCFSFLSGFGIVWFLGFFFCFFYVVPSFTHSPTKETLTFPQAHNFCTLQWQGLQCQSPLLLKLRYLIVINWLSVLILFYILTIQTFCVIYSFLCSSWLTCDTVHSLPMLLYLFPVAVSF